MNDFKLDSRPNIKSGFKAPDSYFESLTDRVMLNLPVQEVKVVPLYRRRPIWVTSAAAALVLSCSLLLTKNEASAPVMPDAAATEDYLVNNMNTYDIQQHLDAEDLTDVSKSVLSQPLNVSNKTIEEEADFGNVSYEL
jgi:hypothetical protein